MSFQTALADLEARGIMPLRAPTLDNTRKALTRFKLHLPADPCKVIAVAGTNGKGSTSKTLETLLRSEGLRTGLYSSPHLIDYRERIQVDGEMISETLFETAWARVASTNWDLPLSHFEMLTVMAAWIFFSGEAGPVVDAAIFEVGLGGLWDATNAIPHGTALIAQLGLDHQEILGTSLLEIARNKFGIVSPGCRVIYQPLAPELNELQLEVMKETQSSWREAPSFDFDVESQNNLPRFFIKSRWGRAPISLPGRRGAQNMNLALTAFEELGFDPVRGLRHLQDVIWPARMQRLTESALVREAACPVFLSGDHNPQGIQSLLELLKFYRWRELRLVVGVGIKKDLPGMLEPLLALPNMKVWFTRAEFQGRSEAQYGEWLHRAQGYHEDPRHAIEAALIGVQSDDLCLITGSLYLAGDVLRKLVEAKTLG